MIRTIFIIQLFCLVGAFINVGATGANSYSELSIIGQTCCIVILVGMLMQFTIQVFGIFKKR
jgi:putative exporter of polyketide antibiotics